MIRTIFFCFLAFGPISAADKDAAAKVDLSPALWPDNEFEQLMKRDQIYPFPKTSAEGKNGMVVTTSSTTATRAGLEALKQGGTAVDAALTTALTQIALNLGSWSSYGGMMVMVVFDAKTGKVYALHGGFQTALAETDPLSVPSDKPHGRAVMVPGFMAAVEAAHKRFGRLPFEQIFTPAIYLAENGFELSPMLGYMIKNREAVIARLPETKAVFAKQDGSLYEAGDLFKQTALARTLRAVSKQGASYMYAGPWAEKLVAMLRAEGGKMTLADLKGYRAIWSEAVTGRYRDIRIHAPSHPNRGGMESVLGLQLMDAAKLDGFADYRQDGEALYWMIQFARVGSLLAVGPVRANFEPSALFGDLDVSYASQAKPETARAIYALMRQPDWTGRIRKALQNPAPGNNHSDAIVAADAFGNVVALTHSINAYPWGQSGYFVDGVSVADSLASQQQWVSQVKPGEHVPEMTNPLILTRNGRPIIASSAVGNGLHEITMQNLVNMLAYGENPIVSTGKPKFYAPVYVPGQKENPDFHKQRIPEGAFPENVLARLKELGQEYEIQGPDVQAGLGYWVGLKIDAETGVISGAPSQNIGGGALAY